MRTETLEEITGLITSLDSDGLNKLIPIIKSHRNTLASMKKTQLSVGDRVSFGEHMGVIDKINRTRVACTTDSGVGYNVPISMIEIL
jgi:hypothetical protein